MYDVALAVGDGDIRENDADISVEGEAGVWRRRFLFRLLCGCQRDGKG